MPWNLIRRRAAVYAVVDTNAHLEWLGSAFLAGALPSFPGSAKSDPDMPPFGSCIERGCRVRHTPCLIHICSACGLESLLLVQTAWNPVRSVPAVLNVELAFQRRADSAGSRTSEHKRHPRRNFLAGHDTPDSLPGGSCDYNDAPGRIMGRLAEKASDE